jgi:hypothetical protein
LNKNQQEMRTEQRREQHSEYKSVREGDGEIRERQEVLSEGHQALSISAADVYTWTRSSSRAESTMSARLLRRYIESKRTPTV